MFTKHLEHDFIFGDTQVFREYDMSGFAVSASNVLRTNNELIYNLNFDFYISMINKAISHLMPLTIDREKALLIKKYGRNRQIDAAGGQIKEFIDPNSIILKPEYLPQMLDNIGLTIDRATRSSISKEEIKRYISSDISEKVKRQVVRSNMPYDASKKAMLTLGAPNLVPFTVKYVSAFPTEFITNWDGYKKETIIEATEVINNISIVKDGYANYMRALDDVKVDAQWENKESDNLYYISFNAMRNLLEVVSFLSYMTIRKIGIVANDIVRSNELLDRLYELFSSPMIESVLDNLIEKGDAKSLGENLSRGNVDAFEELAGKIYDYHKGIYEGSPFDDIRGTDGSLAVPLDMRLDHAEYGTRAYSTIKEMYEVIQHGLATVSKNCDDYLVVFDDILDKSGFTTSLEDKFAGSLQAIENISDYTSAVDISSGVSPDMHIYYCMMSEVKDYAANMEEIANISKDCRTILNELIKRFDDNINTEYKNTLTIKEASEFLRSLNDQMDGIDISVASKFMIRLKNIAICLEKFDKDKSTQLQNSGYQVESPTVLERSIITYTEKMQEAITDYIFEAMVESYTLVKNKKETGIDFVVTESKISDLATKIKAVLIKWYDKVGEKLKGLINSQRAESDKQFLTSNMSSILSGSFANKTSPIEIIEYEKLSPAENMMKDVKSLVKKTSSINLQPDKLKGVTDEESAASILFGSRPPVSVWKDGNPARNIAKFYKCGEYDEKPVFVKNNELKSLVEAAAKYCGDFYSKFLPSLNENINLIKDNITNNLENLMKESAIDELIGNMFLEADEKEAKQEEYKSMDETSKADNKKEEKPEDSSDNTDDNDTNANNSSTNNDSEDKDASNSTTDVSASTTPSTSDPSSSASSTSSTPVADAKGIADVAKKVEMLQRMVQQYCNGVLTAAFDRYKDYINLLKGLSGQPTQSINSSTDKEEPAPAPEQSSEEAPSGGEETSQEEETPAETPAPEENNETASTDEGSDNVDETGLYS